MFLSNTLQKGCKHQDDKSQKRSKVKEVSEGMQKESQSAVLQFYLGNDMLLLVSVNTSVKQLMASHYCTVFKKCQKLGRKVFLTLLCRSLEDAR